MNVNSTEVVCTDCKNKTKPKIMTQQEIFEKFNNKDKRNDNNQQPFGF